jgi:hypothetical protein
MRRRSVLALTGLAVGVLLALSAVASASHDPSGAPFDEDYVTGFVAPPFKCDGAVFCLRTTFSIDAHSGPSGENPSGTVGVGLEEREGGPIGLLDFHVSCLAASGNRATIGIDDTGDGVGDALIFVEDDGGLGQDKLTFTLPFSGPPAVCTSSPPTPLLPADGDITVHDAVPFPTSKEQCRNGGWRNFPGFKNEGDRIAFVATGGKNPPAG